jgi:hypothetical protein
MKGFVRFEVGASLGVICANLGQCIKLGVLLFVSVTPFCPSFWCVSIVFEVHYTSML